MRRVKPIPLLIVVIVILVAVLLVGTPSSLLPFFAISPECGDARIDIYQCVLDSESKEMRVLLQNGNTELTVEYFIHYVDGYMEKSSLVTILSPNGEGEFTIPNVGFTAEKVTVRGESGISGCASVANVCYINP